MDALQLAPLALAAVAYARRCAVLARRGRPVPARRQVWFGAGLALVAAALATPIDTIGEERLFWVHMVQHLMIGDLAAYCVARGLSGAILRPLLAIRAVRPLRALAHPLVALPLWAVTLCAWHIPVLYDAAIDHSGLHALEHGMFLASGALMWAAVLEPVPGPRWFGGGWKIAYVLAVRAVGAGLANVFIWSTHPLYDRYHDLSDQVAGGLIMFTEGGIVTLLVVAWLFLDWMREDGARRARRPPPPPPGAAPPRSPRSSAAPGRSA